MDGSFGIIRTLGTLRIAFGNKVAKNDARVIGRLVPPLSPRSHLLRGDPGIFILCPNLWTTYASMSGSAIERFVEQRQTIQLPLLGIA